MSLLKGVTARLGPSVRAVSILSGGTLLAQVVAIAISPILTRLYTPADFGALASFLAACTWLVTVASARYDQAIALPPDNRDGVHLTVLALLLTLATSVLSLIGVVILVPVLGDQGDYSWLYWLPLIVLLVGANTVLVAYATRQHHYRLISATTMTRALATATAQIGAGLLLPSAGALAGASTLGSGSANIALSRLFLRDLRTSPARLADLRGVAGRFSAFPKHTLPASLISASNINGLPLFIGIAFGAGTLGLWSLAQRLVTLPLGLIGQAVGLVYYRRAAQVRNDAGDSLGLYRRTVLGLAAASIVPFTVIGLLAPMMTEIVFGSEWTAAGDYVRIMLPWLWVRFIASTVSGTVVVLGRNGLGLLIQVGLLTVTAAVSVSAVIFSVSFTDYLMILSAAMAVSYASLILIDRRVLLTVAAQATTSDEAVLNPLAASNVTHSRPHASLESR